MGYCNQINHTLNKSVQTQIRKDEKGYGTYSLNPFAFYPKNLKNTVSHLMSNNDGNLLSN